MLNKWYFVTALSVEQSDANGNISIRESIAIDKETPESLNNADLILKNADEVDQDENVRTCVSSETDEILELPDEQNADKGDKGKIICSSDRL